MGFDSLPATGGFALVACLVLQALKNSPWFPWLSRETGKLNLAISIAAAGATAAGIHWGFDRATDTATITISTHAVGQWFMQWVAQHAIYKKFIVDSETQGEIRSILQRAFPPAISSGEAKRSIGPVVLLACLLWPSLASAQVPACEGIGQHHRWTMKTRSRPAGNVSASPVSVADVVGWDVPAAPRSESMVDPREGEVFRLRAYVRLAKLSVDDCDIHLQVADDPTGNGPQMIIEIPQKDTATQAAIARILGGVHGSPKRYAGAAAKLIEVEGFGFIDQEHATRDGSKKGHAHGSAAVATLWELHPVFVVQEVRTP